MTNEELQKKYVKADMQYDALKDNIHHLAEENKQLKEDIETFKFTITTQQQMIDELIGKLDKAIEILKDTSVDMPSTLLIETIDYARHILGDKENENK